MNEFKKNIFSLMTITGMFIAVIIFFFTKEYTLAAFIGIITIISGYYAEKNHPVKKIIKIKPKEA